MSGTTIQESEPNGTRIMTSLFAKPALALATAGLAVSTPAAALPVAHGTAISANVALDTGVSEYGKKDKRWHRKDERRHYGKQRRVYVQPRTVYVQPRTVYVQPRARYVQPRPYYMGYARNYGQPVYADTRIWRGNDGRYYCRRSNGTTGLLVGAGVGALLGTQVAGRGDQTLGAIVGGVAGALLGRSIDRSSTRCG